MTRYLARRLAFALFLVVAVSSASFVLARLAPGDFVTESLGSQASRQAIERERARFGLDKSIAAQYRAWLAAAVRLDFGRSMQYDRPVSDLIPERAANTAILALAALLLATAVGLPLGIVTGSRPGGVIPSTIRSASLVLLSMPPLLTSLLLVFIAARTGWLPIAGMRSASVPAAGAALDLLHHLVLPAAAIALPLAAMMERLQAQAMTEVVDEPFVRAALARGVPRSRVIWHRHVVQRIIRGRSDHRVAGSGQSDAAGAARAGHLSRRGMRRRRRDLSRVRHDGLGPCARGRGPARERDAIG